MDEMNCESYTEWQARLHPKVAWNYIDGKGFIRSVALPDNESCFIIDGVDRSEVGKDVDPAHQTLTISRLTLKPFFAADSEGEIYFRCMAKDLTEAELIYTRLKGDKK
jgi:hypothetical protein